MIQMRLTGAAELEAKFAEIRLDMARTLAAALIAGAQVIINATKEAAPVKTGNLMRSYHIGTVGRNITEPQATDGAPQPVSAAGVAAVADMLRRSREARVLEGTDVEYAPPQEFLHKPHLRPALEGNRAEVRAEVRRAIVMMIRKAAG